MKPEIKLIKSDKSNISIKIKAAALLLAVVFLLTFSLSCTGDPGDNSGNTVLPPVNNAVPDVPSEPAEPHIKMPAVEGFDGLYNFTSMLGDLTYVSNIKFLDDDTVYIEGVDSEETTLCLIIDMYGDSARELPVLSDIYSDSRDGALLLADETSIVWYPNVAESDEHFTYSSDSLVNAACTVSGYCCVENSELCFIDGRTGDVTCRIPLPVSGDNIFFERVKMCDSGEYAYVSYAETGDSYRRAILVVPLDGGDIYKISCDENISYCNSGFDGNAVIQYYSRGDIFTVTDGKTKRDVLLKSTEEIYEDISERLLLTSQLSFENYIRLYDLQSGECISRFNVPISTDEGNLIEACVNSDGSAVCMYFKRYGEPYISELYFCLTAGFEPEQGFYVPVFDDPPVDYEALSENEKTAYDLGEKYGLVIRIGEAASEAYMSYTHDTLTDPEAQRVALEALENVLSKYPDGFFRELQSGPYRRLIINLTGMIYDDTTGAPAGVGGYFSEKRERLTASVTVNAETIYSLESTYAHELMHAADAYIKYYKFDEKNDGYSDWYDYLPEGFEYNGSYNDENGDGYFNPEYTAGDGESPIYFVDIYSKTFATEDRAQCFSSAFVYGDDFIDNHPKSKSFSYETVTARTRYIFRVYREVFETVRNAGYVFWERGFE